jgi:iron-sulfur cluster assembly protein
MFSLSAAAAEQIRLAAAQSEAADLALRVAARRLADGDVEFGMGFDEPREGDMPLQAHGVNLLIGAPSQALLDDTLLDYVELEPGTFGFVFQASATEPAQNGGSACRSGGCGSCGSSSGRSC